MKVPGDGPCPIPEQEPPRPQDVGEAAVARAIRRLPPWLLLLKTALVLGGLSLLLRWVVQSLPDAGVVVPAWSLLGAVLLNELALFAAALRLQRTLAVFGVRLRLGDAFRIHLQSLFYFFFVPMSVGLEVARFVKIRDIQPATSARRLVLALLLDRVLGLAAALAVAGALLPAVFPDLLPRLWHPGWAAGVLAGVCVIGGALWLHPATRTRLADATLAVVQAGRHFPVLILLSLAALLLVCASVYLIAVGVRIEIGPVELTFALSTSLLGMLVPVSVLGATLGEAAGAGVFTLLGLSTASGLLLVSAAYAGRLLGALQGGLIELWIDRGRARAPADAHGRGARSGNSST